MQQILAAVERWLVVLRAGSRWLGCCISYMTMDDERRLYLLPPNPPPPKMPTRAPAFYGNCTEGKWSLIGRPMAQSRRHMCDSMRESVRGHAACDVQSAHDTWMLVTRRSSFASGVLAPRIQHGRGRWYMGVVQVPGWIRIVCFLGIL